jgi:hypothetical protein
MTHCAFLQGPKFNISPSSSTMCLHGIEMASVIADRIFFEKLLKDSIIGECEVWKSQCIEKAGKTMVCQS